LRAPRLWVAAFWTLLWGAWPKPTPFCFGQHCWELKAGRTQNTLLGPRRCRRPQQERAKRRTHMVQEVRLATGYYALSYPCTKHRGRRPWLKSHSLWLPLSKQSRQDARLSCTRWRVSLRFSDADNGPSPPRAQMQRLPSSICWRALQPSPISLQTSRN
jgi:hypothetical protein